MQSLSDRRALVGVALSLLVAFAFGRFSAPEKVRVETKTVEIHSHVDEQNHTVALNLAQDQHLEVVVTQIVRPDGTHETTTRTISDSETHRDSVTSSEHSSSDTMAKETDKIKEVTRGSGKLDISVLAGPRISLSSGVGPMVYGVHVSRPLIGPITVGLWGMSSGEGGVSVGLQF